MLVLFMRREIAGWIVANLHGKSKTAGKDILKTLCFPNIDEERRRRVEFMSEARDGGGGSGFGVGPGDWRDRERERARDRDRERERRDRERERDRELREGSSGKEKSTDTSKDGSQEPELQTTEKEQQAIRVRLGRAVYEFHPFFSRQISLFIY